MNGTSFFSWEAGVSERVLIEQIARALFGAWRRVDFGALSDSLRKRIWSYLEARIKLSGRAGSAHEFAEKFCGLLDLPPPDVAGDLCAAVPDAGGYV